MKQFRKNVFRLALKNKGSFAGSAMIIAIGVFVMVSMFDTLLNLSGQINAWYRRAELGDVFCTVSGISAQDLRRVTELPGIRAASGRLSEDVRLYREGQDGIVTVHLMAGDGVLNRPDCTAELEADDRILIGTRMQEAFCFKEGDEIRILYRGKSAVFTYAGTVSAPDYIYSVPPSGSMVPDGRVYDIAMVSEKAMRKILGTEKYNEISFQLSPDFRYEDVRHALTGRLERFGLTGMLPRKDQPSVSMVEDEVHELVTVGTILPVIFMAISIFMLYTVLQKMIERDRMLIGTMKAFGLTNRELLFAYLAEGVLTGLAGAAAGGMTAGLLGRYMFDMYVDFFNLPDSVYHDFAGTRLLGAVFALVTAVSAVFLGIRKILDITPSMAMRAHSPENVRQLKVFRNGSFLVRMAMRSLLRNPFRSFLIALSAAFPFAMSSVLLSYGGVVQDMILTEFSEVEQFDYMLTLDAEHSPCAAEESAEQLPGVLSCCGIYADACVFCKDGITEYGVLNGRPAERSFWKIRDNSGRFYEPPLNGILLDHRIAAKLHVKKGDLIEILPSGSGTIRKKVRIAGVVEEMFRGGACLDLGSFPELLDRSPSVNRLLLRTDRRYRDLLLNRLTKAGRVRFLSENSKIVDAYRDMFGSMTIMIDIFAALSVAAGGILISSILLISLRERMTEFTTLRILGTTGREIGVMLYFEQMVLFALGILMGIPGNLWIRGLLESMMKSDSYTIRLPFRAGAAAISLFICFCMVTAAWAREMSMLRRVPLTDALKDRGE